MKFASSTLLTVSAAALASFSPTSACNVPAFPGAIGFGKCASGGRGGTVHVVSTLDDLCNGSPCDGSLRAAIAASGPRMLVFNISGYIDLTDEININEPNITIAGQTSPNGITLRGSRLKVKASNVIVRGMRFRAGDGSGGDSVCSNRDGFGIGHDSSPMDVVFDHCSATWAMDENGSSWYTSSRTTVSNCIFAEGIFKQCNADGGFGYLIGSSSTIAAPTKISLIRNVFVSNRDRNPYVKDNATEIEVINNIGYNHKSAGFGFGDAATTVNLIKNYFKHGPDSHSRPSCYLYDDTATLTNVYLQGNIDTEYRCDATSGDETDICHKTGNAIVQPGDVALSPVFVGSGFAELDANLVPFTTSYEAGAIHPSRDFIDTRIFDTINIAAADCSGDLGSGAIISSVSSVGGYPAVLDVPPPMDSDYDGIPDAIEDDWCLDKTDPTDSSIIASSGYSYLEEYVNSEFYTPGATTACTTSTTTSSATTTTTTSTTTTKSPTKAPTSPPTNAPSNSPTHFPTSPPTETSTYSPSKSPTHFPTSPPTETSTKYVCKNNDPGVDNICTNGSTTYCDDCSKTCWSASCPSGGPAPTPTGCGSTGDSCANNGDCCGSIKCNSGMCA